MSRSFTPKTFLLKAPNTLLQEYFLQRAPDMIVEWDQIAERDVDPILEAWYSLKPSLASAIENDFRSIHELASEEGIEVLLQQAAFHDQDLREALQAQEGMVAKSLWARLHYPDLFQEAFTFFEADQLDSRSLRKCKDLPRKSPDLRGEALDELKKSLAAYYMRRQGRGRRCDVHYLLRSGNLHYFFAYPEEHSADILTYGDTEKLERLTVTRVSEVVFAYSPEEGSLKLFARGGKDLQDDLTLLFCRTILHEEVSAGAPNSKVYELNGLKERSHAFPTEPADGILGVKIKRIRLTVVGKKEHRIILEVDTRAEAASVHTLLETALDRERLPLTNVTITQATLQVLFRRAEGKTSTVPFTITWPDKCTLSDKPDHLVIQRKLAPWKLENVKSLPVPVGSERSA